MCVYLPPKSILMEEVQVKLHSLFELNAEVTRDHGLDSWYHLLVGLTGLAVGVFKSSFLYFPPLTLKRECLLLLTITLHLWLWLHLD